MVKLAALKRLMQRHGMCYQPGRQAASLEIVPLGDELFDPGGSLEQNQASQPPVHEGGGCDSCAPGCYTCAACESGCIVACSVACQSGPIF